MWTVTRNASRQHQSGPLSDLTQQEWETLAAPINWFNKAVELKECAQVLSQRQADSDKFIQRLQEGKPMRRGFFPHMLDQQHWMIVAYCLENLLKARIIKNNPELLRDKRIHSKLTTHNLITLAKTAGVKVSKDEMKYLDLWTQASIFRGKYPVPLGEDGAFIEYTYSVVETQTVFNTLFERFAKGI
jgi:hypothetical protein